MSVDALMFGTRDMVRENLGYSAAQCELVGPEGEPPPRCGQVFLGIHQGEWRNESTESLDEYFGVYATLTMRIGIPLDRIGELIASKTAEQMGFNRRAERIRAFLHKGEPVIGRANQWLMKMAPQGSDQIYGFSEPLIFNGMEPPHFVTGSWFGGDPGSIEVGIAARLSFDRARRLQPIGVFT